MTGRWNKDSRHTGREEAMKGGKEERKREKGGVQDGKGGDLIGSTTTSSKSI